MQVKKPLWNLDIIFVALSISIINIGLTSFIQDKLNENIIGKLLTDAVIIIIAGFIGKYLISKIGFPLWWNRDASISLRRQLVTLITLGLAIIIPNTLMYYLNQDLISTVPWLDFSNYKEVILLSLRAGLHEEILFRLFIFTIVTYLANIVIVSAKKSVIVGIIISSFLFGLMHGGINTFAIIYGAILAHVYYKNGLIPAIIIHFLADAIPWTLLYVLNK
ncbi:CAAX protease self-immunity [Natronincola peptidivorans]|uniref:CAAX protease self-immunity n=1 Tax=Natronincola peptidivorans TaxID=426128 RepID=A0A1I0FUJ4_9FIRM|nr:CPBP family intramembrane glutamic endopeptidase [Natronincola peptidivorans]SET61241.1 CAAX protease self-immunity [Natronincola peptidivorans]